MAQQLKRWESPRRKGRNHRGRGGSAKQRQYKKRQKLLMKRLQKGIDGSAESGNNSIARKGKGSWVFPFFVYVIPSNTCFQPKQARKDPDEGANPLLILEASVG